MPRDPSLRDGDPERIYLRLILAFAIWILGVSCSTHAAPVVLNGSLTLLNGVIEFYVRIGMFLRIVLVGVVFCFKCWPPQQDDSGLGVRSARQSTVARLRRRSSDSAQPHLYLCET